MNKILDLIFIAFIAFALGCGNNLAGGGLDTESSGGKLFGSVVFSDGVFASNTRVSLIPFNHTPFNHSVYKTTNSDSLGKYFFDSISAGLYNIEAYSPDSGTRLLHLSILISDACSLGIESDTLKIPSKIIVLRDSLTFGVYYIPGSTVKRVVTDTVENLIVIDSIPSGTLPSLYYKANSVLTETKLTDTIVLQQGTTFFVSINNSAQSYSIKLNTTSKGDNLAKNLYGIPILVRLDRDNFNFDDSLIDTSKILFVDANGHLFDHEIERWDNGQKIAEIWVSLDSLYAGTDTQSIFLYWNKTESVTEPLRNTFDTLLNFTGVWHLCEEKVGIKNHDLFKDVTLNKNHGDDFIRSRGRNGIVGFGTQFSNSDTDYVIIPGHQQYSFGVNPFSVSLWFKKIDSSGADLFVYKISSGSPHEFGIAVDSANSICFFVLYEEKLNILCKSMPVTTDIWHQIYITRDQTDSVRLFIDGELAEKSTFHSIYGNDISSCDAVIIGSNIGTNSKPYNVFNGEIDEVRLESIDRSPEWIMTNFRNTSPDSKLVEVSQLK